MVVVLSGFRLTRIAHNALTTSTLHMRVDQSKNVAVQEQQRRERLILCRAADMFFRRKMSQICIDLRLAHLGRVAFVMEQDEALDPMDVRFFRPFAVMSRTYRETNLIE